MKYEDDILGEALKDYISGKTDGKINIYSPDFEKDEIRVSWYFRDYNLMPELEKMALSLCKGPVLDAGAGAGCHSLYLQSAGLDVTAMDISLGACEVMKKREIKKVINDNIFSSQLSGFQTILMMMNGIGITSGLVGLAKFLDKLPEILNENGQLIFDSSNLIYLFRDENDVAYINLMDKYYGEVEFQMEYAGKKGVPFEWLYVDFDLISEMCEERDFNIELLAEGDNFQYLARIFF